MAGYAPWAIDTQTSFLERVQKTVEMGQGLAASAQAQPDTLSQWQGPGPDVTPAWQSTTVQNTPDTGMPDTSGLDFGAMQAEPARYPGPPSYLQNASQEASPAYPGGLVYGNEPTTIGAGLSNAEITRRMLAGESLDVIPGTYTGLPKPEPAPLPSPLRIPLGVGQLLTGSPGQGAANIYTGAVTPTVQLPDWLPKPLRDTAEFATSPLGIASLAFPGARVATLKSLAGSAAAGTGVQLAGGTEGQQTLAELLGSAAPLAPGAGKLLRGAEALAAENVPGAARTLTERRLGQAVGEGARVPAGAAETAMPTAAERTIADIVPQREAAVAQVRPATVAKENIFGDLLNRQDAVGQAARSTVGRVINPGHAYAPQVMDNLTAGERLSNTLDEWAVQSRMQIEDKFNQVFDFAADKTTVTNVVPKPGFEGASVRFGDIVSNPQRYDLTPTQTSTINDFMKFKRGLEAYDASKGVAPNRYIGVRAEDISQVPPGLETSAEHFPRVVVDTPAGPPTRGPVQGAGLPGGKPGFGKPRSFGQEADGVAAGFDYAPPFDALQSSLQASGRSEANKFIKDQAAKLGILPKEKGFVVASDAEVQQARGTLAAARLSKDPDAIAAARADLLQAQDARRIAGERATAGAIGERRVFGLGARLFPEDVAKAYSEFYDKGMRVPVLAEVADLFQTIALNFDQSPMGRQGLLVGAQHPVAYAKSIVEGERALASNDFWRAYRTAKADVITESTAHGGIFPREQPEFRAVQQSILLKVPGVSQGIKLSQAYFDRVVTTLRVNAYEAEKAKQIGMLGKSSAAELTAAELDQVAEKAAEAQNLLTGTAEVSKLGIGRGRALTERNFVIATTYWRNQMTGVVRAALGGANADMSRAALLKLFGGALILGEAVAKTQGKDINLDPNSGEFFDIPLPGNRYISILGPYKSMARTIFSGPELAAQVATGQNLGAESRANPLKRAALLGTGKLTPAAQGIAASLGLPTYQENQSAVQKIVGIFLPLTLQQALQNPELAPAEFVGLATHQKNQSNQGETITTPGRAPLTQTKWEDLTDKQRQKLAEPLAAQSFQGIPWDELSDMQRNSALAEAKARHDAKQGPLLEADQALGRQALAKEQAKETKAQQNVSDPELDALAQHLHGVPFGALPDAAQNKLRVTASNYTGSEIPAVTQTWEDVAQARYGEPMAKVTAAKQSEIMAITPKLDSQMVENLKEYYGYPTEAFDYVTKGGATVQGGPLVHTMAELELEMEKAALAKGLPKDYYITGNKVFSKLKSDYDKALHNGQVNFLRKNPGVSEIIGVLGNKPTDRSEKESEAQIMGAGR